MRLSRLTVDKLGVKLYDRVSAVVAELIANGYDADAEHVTMRLPLGTQLARGDTDLVDDEEADVQPDLLTFADMAVEEMASNQADEQWSIEVVDDGHGMTPSEAQNYFLVVGADRRKRQDGAESREKKRPVMGRKGIGKLAPFGICHRIEVKSAGGPLTEKGYEVSHFILDFDSIVQDADTDIPIESGADDGSFAGARGTTVKLSQFLPKRVPSAEVFVRQVARRFALARSDFGIVVEDTRGGVQFPVPAFQVEVNEDTRVYVDDRPVRLGKLELPVSGWLAFGRHAYRDEEEAGVRIYARDKIVATTRDFEQPAGFTGEFTARSYLVGEIHAEWLDSDEHDDLVRTDRQGILWDSEYGQALRKWGSTLIKEIAKASSAPRRKAKADRFLEESGLMEAARARYSDESVIMHVETLGRKIGAFAQEDELDDPDYVSDLAEVVLSLAPHHALIDSLRKITGQEDKTVDDLLGLFAQARVAEMASYAQIASERVDSIEELKRAMDNPDVNEGDLQKLIASAPWLIEPTWTVISDNRALKTFRDRFVKFWKDTYGNEVVVAISFETKRPDFTLINMGTRLHVVEIKRPGHPFDGNDYSRLENYLEAFDGFFKENLLIADSFPKGWVIDLIADSVNLRETTKRRSFEAAEKDGQVRRQTWEDFLMHSTLAHEEFLDARENARSQIRDGVAPQLDGVGVSGEGVSSPDDVGASPMELTVVESDPTVP